FGVRLGFHAAPQTGPGTGQGAGAGVGVGRVQVRWDPAAGRWQLLDDGTVVAHAEPGPLATADWQLIAGRNAVLFFVDGRQILSYWFPEPVTGPLTLTAGGAGLGFGPVAVFHEPRVSIGYADGSGRVRQRQALGDDGTVVSGEVTDPLGRP